MKLRIGSDIDGVLCSILPECIQAGKNHSLIPDHIQMSDIVDDLARQFDWPENAKEEIFNEEFYMNLPAHWDVVDSVIEWKKQGHEIFFITARPHQYKDVTFGWLQKHNLINNPEYCIHTTSGDKYKDAQRLNLDVFIDDYPKVIKNMKGIVPHMYVLKGPINQHYDGDVFEWDEIKASINKLIRIKD